MSMGWIKLFNDLSICFCFVIFVPRLVLSIDKKLPFFESLPPPIQYYANGESQIVLRCQVWPNDAKIQFVVSSRKQWHSPDDISKSLSVSPLDRNIGNRVSPGLLKITNHVHLNQIQDQDIHCLAGTDFATILSRPFRVTRGAMSDFGGSIGSKIKTVTKEFLQGNVAFIDCWPPESHPKAEVKFIFNEMEIKDGGKYRIVHWSDSKRVSLLIHSVEQQDSGLYRCTATNKVTLQVRKSIEIVNLKVIMPKTSAGPIITMPLSGRMTGSHQLTARQGTNVTLFCVMQGTPPPNIKIYNHNNDLTKDSRYTVDNIFGLLHITNVQPIDDGTYICSDTYLTSSANLKIIEPLNITTKPADVVLDSLSGEATFVCVPSKATVPVAWFFNGRPISSTTNNTVLRVPTVTANSLGLYQCVVQDKDEWASSAATLSIRSYNLISRPFSDPIGKIQIPVALHIDNDGRIIASPNAKRIFDNLAVFVTWKLGSSQNFGSVLFYVVQIQHWIEDENIWSKNPVTVQEKINATFLYVTDRYVQPQNKYQFRVHTFFDSGHVITSLWSNGVLFMNMGIEAPVIEEVEEAATGRIVVRWSYQNTHNWPVETFRILLRQVFPNASEQAKKYSKHTHTDVTFPVMNATLDSLKSGVSYQLVVFGLHTSSGTRTTTKFSEPRNIQLKAEVLLETATQKSQNKFFSGLWESWKSNKVLYGSLFALTGLMLLIMFLLLLLCLCRQRKFRTAKNMGSTNAFPYNYKEVCKTASVANNNSSTLQIPGRMPQHPSQLGLQQYQQNNNSLDRRNTDTSSQIYRAGSVQAMETASLVTDLYGHNYMHGMQMSHMQHPYQGFSTLQLQNYPSNHGRSVPQYHHYLPQQQQHSHQMGPMIRENPPGDSNRDSITDQSMEMAPRNINASQHQQQQQHLMMMQQGQDQQRHNLGYYNQRQGAMSPQMMTMMMGSQQSLANSGQYRRSNSQNYSMQSMETPIALNSSGHPIYQMDQVLVDSTGRPLSPQYHYMQQQQQQQQHHQQQQHQQQQQQQQHHQQQLQQQQNSHAGQMHPSMMDMYNQSHPFSRPMVAEYQQSLNRQQYRRSDSDCGSHEPGYSYLSTPHGAEIMSSRQHTLNSLPEQPLDNNNRDHHDSPGPIITSNNNSSGRHHHRRKTRSRQANNPEPSSLERNQVMKNRNDMPPMLAPRSKLPYPEHQGMHRLSAHDMNTIDSHDNPINDCNSESNTAGAVSDNFEPPLQYSGHYDTSDSKYRMDCNMDMNDNEATPSNSLLIENLPRVRDVSEYGIPVNNNSSSNNSHGVKQAPVPPLKSNTRHNPVPNNGYGLECNPDYYSSATSSDRSGPSPPPKYAPGVVLPARPDEMYMREQRDQMFYHGDTHC